MSKPEVVLCSPVRTAIATFGGIIKDNNEMLEKAAIVRQKLEAAIASL